MALRVMAFDESTAAGRLQKELFRSSRGESSAGTVVCPKCSVLFAVFFPNIDDVEKITHIKALEQKISNDCGSGKHSAEYAVMLDRST